MDPTIIFCPNERCPARGQTGHGNIGIHSRKEQRFICHECDKTFSARRGTVFYRLRTSAETVVLVVTLLAHGCPVQAMVAAFGCDKRTVADWWARSGRQGQAVQEFLVERPRALGQVQADELRVKKQGGIVWMALAMMVKTRLWLGGKVSEQRDMLLIRRLIERVKRCAAHRPLLICTDGLVSYIRAIQETIRDPVHTGKGGRPRLHPWRQVFADRPGGQALRAAAGGRDRPPGGLSMAPPGTRGDTSTPVARGRGDQYGLHRAAERDVPGTPRAAGASVPGAGTSPPDTARRNACGGRGLWFYTRIESLSHTQQTTPAMAAGITDHCWTIYELLSFHVPLSRWVPPKRRGRPSRALQHLIKRWCS